MQDPKELDSWSRQHLLRYIRKSWDVSFDGLLVQLNCPKLVGNTSAYPMEALRATAHLANKTGGHFFKAHDTITRVLGKSNELLTWAKFIDVISKANDLHGSAEEVARLRSELEAEKAKNAALTKQLSYIRECTAKFVGKFIFHYITESTKAELKKLNYEALVNLLPRKLAAESRKILIFGNDGAGHDGGGGGEDAKADSSDSDSSEEESISGQK